MTNIGQEEILARIGPAQRCRTGCPELDDLLAGGVPCNSITEFISEGGIGKTQLCLQLSLQVHLPAGRGGLGGSCVYIYTDYAFPVARLLQLGNYMVQRRQSREGVHPVDTVFVEFVADAPGLLGTLSKIQAKMERGGGALPVRMIIIDSIASLVRSQFNNTPTEMAARACLLIRIARRLKDLATQFDLAVVTTNQVRAFIAGRERGDGGLGAGYLPELYTSGSRVVPSLGRSWANWLDTRFFLSRQWRNPRGVEGGHQLLESRRLWVLNAVHLRRGSIEFEILNEGVRGIPVVRNRES